MSELAAGAFVAVVGPSGAGKDTVMRIAGDLLGGEPRVHFVRRVITRPADGSEDHQPASPEEFARRLAEGGLGLHWQAHGLSYGLPRESVERLRRGHVVVANVSRTVLSEIAVRFPRHVVVEVTADDAIRAARIGARNRASDSKSQDRLVRAVELPPLDRTIVIENNGEARDAGEQLARAIRDCLLGDISVLTEPLHGPFTRDR